MGHFPGDVGANLKTFSMTLLPAGVITHVAFISNQPDTPHGVSSTNTFTVWINGSGTIATCSFSDADSHCEWTGSLRVPLDAFVNYEMGETCGGACPNTPISAMMVFTPNPTNWPFLTEDYTVPRYIARRD